MGFFNGLIIYKLGKRRGRKKAERRAARGAIRCPDFVETSDYYEEYGYEQHRASDDAGPPPETKIEADIKEMLSEIPRPHNFGRRGLGSSITACRM